MGDIAAHQAADRSYIEEGIKLLELSQKAAQLFDSQPPSEKRKLLDFVLSNCSWKEGRLDAEYRQPFDLIASAAFADRQLRLGSSPETSNFDNWRRKRDSNPRASFPANGFQVCGLPFWPVNGVRYSLINQAFTGTRQLWQYDCVNRFQSRPFGNPFGKPAINSPIFAGVSGWPRRGSAGWRRPPADRLPALRGRIRQE